MGSPHVSAGTGHLGSAGTGLHGLPTSGNVGSHMGSQPIYHLSSLPPPPSIAEPGSNSLDDVLKAPGESEYLKLFINCFKYIGDQNIREQNIELYFYLTSLKYSINLVSNFRHLETKTIWNGSKTGNI